MSSVATIRPSRSPAPITTRRAAASKRNRKQVIALPPHSHERTPLRFTVAQYYQLGAIGIIASNQRTELIDGEVIMLPPTDPIHSEGSDEGQSKLKRLVKDRVKVRCQQPIHLSDTSEPIPDISVVKVQSYWKQHPTPDDIYLVIEMANTSLRDDLNEMRDLYARAAIKEYWVLDLQGRELHVFTKPRRGVYTEQRLFAESEKVQCSTVPSIKLKVSELLP